MSNLLFNLFSISNLNHYIFSFLKFFLFFFKYPRLYSIDMYSFVIHSMPYFISLNHIITWWYFVFGICIIQNLCSLKFDLVICCFSWLLFKVAYFSYFVIILKLCTHVFQEFICRNHLKPYFKMFSSRQDLFPSARCLEAQPTQSTWD